MGKSDTGAMSYEDACKILNVDPEEAHSNPQAVRSAYKKLALEFHPDKHPQRANKAMKSGDGSKQPSREDFEKKFRQVVRAYDALTREQESDNDDGEDGEDFGGPNGDFDGVFKSPEDMRDFAANFFESFFFGGGFAQGGRGRRRRQNKDGDDDDSYEYSDEDSDENDDEYGSGSDEYDSERDGSDSYSDDDDGYAYADLRKFFGKPPPGWSSKMAAHMQASAGQMGADGTKKSKGTSSGGGGGGGGTNGGGMFDGPGSRSNSNNSSRFPSGGGGRGSGRSGSNTNSGGDKRWFDSDGPMSYQRGGDSRGRRSSGGREGPGGSGGGGSFRRSYNDNPNNRDYTDQDDDQLFEHLEKMRKEAAKYAADIAKKENERRRASAPLEKLQRPTLVSRTDNTITLNVYRHKSGGNLPPDRCWELSLKKQGDQNFTVYAAVRGNPVVTVSDLLPGTRYHFKARVGRVSSEKDDLEGEKSKSSMDVLSETVFSSLRDNAAGGMKGVEIISEEDVTEWGDYSIESAYATSGSAPRQGQVTVEEVQDVNISAPGQGKKAKKKQAQKEKSEQEALNKQHAEYDAAKAIDEAQLRREALKKAMEEAAEREMAELNAIKEKLAKKEAATNAAASLQTNNPSASAASSSALSKKAAQRQKKKEKAAAAAAAAAADEVESDEAMARRLQLEEQRRSGVLPTADIDDDGFQQARSAKSNATKDGAAESWAAAPAMPLPKGQQRSSAQQRQTYEERFAPPPPPGPPPFGSPTRTRSSIAVPPVPPGPPPGRPSHIESNVLTKQQSAPLQSLQQQRQTSLQQQMSSPQSSYPSSSFSQTASLQGNSLIGGSQQQQPLPQRWNEPLQQPSYLQQQQQQPSYQQQLGVNQQSSLVSGLANLGFGQSSSSSVPQRQTLSMFDQQSSYQQQSSTYGQRQQPSSFLQQEQQRQQQSTSSIMPSWDPLTGSSQQASTNSVVASVFGQSPPISTSRGLGAFGDYGGAFGVGAFGTGTIGSIAAPIGGSQTQQQQYSQQPNSPSSRQQQQTDGQFLENLDNLFDLIGD